MMMGLNQGSRCEIYFDEWGKAIILDVLSKLKFYILTQVIMWNKTERKTDVVV